MDGHTLEMKIPNCEAFPPRMLKPSCGKNQQGDAVTRTLPLGKFSFHSPGLLPVQGPSSSPELSSLQCLRDGPKAWVLQCSARQQHQALHPNSCHRAHLRGLAPILHQLHIPGYPIGNNPSTAHRAGICHPARPTFPGRCRLGITQSQRPFYQENLREPRQGWRHRTRAGPGRRRPPHLRSGRLLEDDGAGQELRELVVVVGVIDALRGTRGGSAGAGPGSPRPARPRHRHHHPRAVPRSPRPGLTSCGGTQAGGLS